MKINGIILKKALRSNFIGQEIAAHKLGISRQTLQVRFKQDELDIDFVLKVKRVLNIDLETYNLDDNVSNSKQSVEKNTHSNSFSDIERDAHRENIYTENSTFKDKPKPSIPMYDIPGTASQLEVYNDLQYEGPAFYVSIPQFRDCKFGKIVYGHSMYPTITSGTYVFCKPVTDKFRFIPGEVYYIEYDNFGVCKRLKKGPANDEVLLVSDNEELSPDGSRKYENYILKINDIRNIYLVKGHFNQAHN